MKKKYIIVMIFIILGVFVLLALNCSKEENISKSLICQDIFTQEKFTVNISGVFYTNFVKDDVFVGTIEIEGKREDTRKFELYKDMYTNLTDEYGQPMDRILQFKQFSYISIVGENYNICSRWNPEWNHEYEQQKKWNEFLKSFLGRI